MMAKRENFYRRDPSKALSGMIGLTLEERGVYNTVLDLLYSTWRPLEDDRAFIANWCGCAVQKLNPIIRRLVEKGRLITFTESGRTYLSDDAFEAEQSAVKGSAATRSGRGEVEEKSRGVGEKSASVGQNPPLCDDKDVENQLFTPLEKSRVEENRVSEANASSHRAPVAKPDGFARFWEAYPNKVGKPVAAKAYAKALKRISGPDPPGVILAGVERAKASRKWREGIYPNPATWLNQDRWLDEPAEVVPLQPRQPHERPHHDAKFEARQANLASALRGADSAPRLYREP